MRVTIPYKPYNGRRDGRPWICRITNWPIGEKFEVVWGQTLGSDRAGGEMVIDAAPGDILRWGQNDLRRSNHTYRKYGRVNPDGSVTTISEPAAAAAMQEPAAGRLDLPARIRALAAKWSTNADRAADPVYAGTMRAAADDLLTLLNEENA